jgi:hypothetical protein
VKGRGFFFLSPLLSFLVLSPSLCFLRNKKAKKAAPKKGEERAGNLFPRQQQHPHVKLSLLGEGGERNRKLRVSGEARVQVKSRQRGGEKRKPQPRRGRV